jgi:hypothetical protein
MPLRRVNVETAAAQDYFSGLCLRYILMARHTVNDLRNLFALAFWAL